MRTYLVTGGAGFIGSNYIHYMFRKYDNEIRIINVDVLTYAGNLENLKDIENRDNYTFIKADICDREAIEKIFAENDIDRVVHFAAESHVDRSIRNPEVFVQTNVMGTAVMLNAAKKAWELPDGTFKADKKFLHVSTDEVYGNTKGRTEGLDKGWTEPGDFTGLKGSQRSPVLSPAKGAFHCGGLRSISGIFREISRRLPQSDEAKGSPQQSD